MLKIGFIKVDEDFEPKELTGIQKEIGEENAQMELDIDADFRVFAVYNKESKLEESLTKDEKNNIWNRFMELYYTDFDEYPKEIVNAYQNGVLTIPMEQFKEMLQ